MTRRPSAIPVSSWPAALRLDQAAEYCGLSVDTFKKVCPVKPIPLAGRYLRIRLDEWRDSLPVDGCIAIPAPGIGPVEGARAGRIYVAGFGNYVKIGFTSGDIETRISDLQTGCPEMINVYAVLDGSPSYERHLQRRFAHLCTQGEWFRREAELAEWIGGGFE